MELTRTRVMVGASANIGRDSDLVQIEETVELNDEAMERVIEKLVDGRFDCTSEAGRWNKVREIGVVTERNEAVSGGL